MTRVEAVGDDPGDPRVARVWERFATEGRPPIALYRALANAPHVLEPYSALAQALRNDAVTPRALRELVILRVAHLAGSEYEWSHHRKMAGAAGVTDAQIRGIASWWESDAFDDRERAALRLADEAHELEVSEETVRLLGRYFDRTATVELIMLASLYEAVARLIQALGIGVEDDYRPYLGVP